MHSCSRQKNETKPPTAATAATAAASLLLPLCCRRYASGCDRPTPHPPHRMPPSPPAPPPPPPPAPPRLYLCTSLATTHGIKLEMCPLERPLLTFCLAPLASRRFLPTVTALSYRGWAWPAPQRGRSRHVPPRRHNHTARRHPTRGRADGSEKILP